MPNIPSDRRLLQEIYDRHYGDFVAYSKEQPNRRSKIFVPVDIRAIAAHFKVDNDIIFGRLYYHLQEKYGYKRANGSDVWLFTPVAGQDKDCINMPLLSAVLAGLREEHSKHVWSLRLSIASLVVSIIALLFSLAAQ